MNMGMPTKTRMLFIKKIEMFNQTKGWTALLDGDFKLMCMAWFTPELKLDIPNSEEKLEMMTPAYTRELNYQ